ncbi:MAG: calcium/proton exchanger [Gemmatimonadota bacterium]
MTSESRIGQPYGSLRVGRLLRVENLLNLLLGFVPAALLLEFFFHVGGVPVFVTSAVAIVPLAGLMGKATEALAARVGAGIGGFLNATFGNAAELIIAIFALRAGLVDLVKASLTGSIIGNVLLIFGLSALAGGLRHSRQTFNRTAASMGTTLLLLSVVALVVPAIFHAVSAPGVAAERALSVEISLVLLLTYGLGLLFSLRTHQHLYAGRMHEAGEEGGEAGWSRRRAFAVLLLSAALVGVMSEILVGAVTEAAERLGMTELFVGVIVVAVVGNAAEHSTAVLMAWKDRMDLAIHIAVGSSVQIALFVAPLLVLLSYLLGPTPMDLRFTTLEVLAVTLAALVIVQIAHDGETNWMEGVQMLAVYAILGLAFFYLPV